MRITRKWIFIVPAICVTGPIWWQLATKPLQLLNDTGVFVASLGLLAMAAVAGVLSLLVVSIVQKPHWENRIYVFGQLAVPLTVLVIAAYGFISNRHYNKYKANIEYNHDFIRMAYHGEEDTAGYHALDQLEGVFENKNDLRLSRLHTDKIDTSINGHSDYVSVILLRYTDKRRPGENFYSKHFLGLHVDKMAFYHVPETELPEIVKRREASDRQSLETIREATEVLDKMNLDSIRKANKND